MHPRHATGVSPVTRPSAAARIGRTALVCLTALLGLGLVAGGDALAGSDGQPSVLATEVSTEITPVVSDHIADGIEEAAAGDYDAYVIELDTPGGLETSMREIVQHVLASRTPVIVHVAPEGARAASAGAVITLASHVAVMAPGTAIGAATPIPLQGDLPDEQAQKVIEDSAAYTESLAELRGRDTEFAVAMVVDGESISASEAVERGAVDGGAASLEEALEIADGAEVDAAGEAVTVSTSGAAVDRQDMGLFREVQQVLANPNLAFILMALAVLGLLYELASPGVGIGGTVGAVSLVLLLFSLAILPVNVAGLLLLALSVALFAGELFAPGFAGFAVGGAVALVLGALFLFDDAEGVAVDPIVAVPTAVALAVLAIIAGRLVVRSQRRPTKSSGEGAFTGRVITVDEVPDTHTTQGRSFVDGSWWRLRSTGEPLHDGQQVEVVDMDGLTLVVEPERVAR